MPSRLVWWRVAIVACLIVASLAGNVPRCGNNGPCLGPVAVTFPSIDCSGSPSFKQILPNEIALEAQGTCINVKSSSSGPCLQSMKWSCSKIGLEMAKYDAPDCDTAVYQVPYKTETYTTDRCFNANDYSYAFSCSNTSLTMSLNPPQTQGEPFRGPPLGAPLVPCPNNKCPYGVPHITTYNNPLCMGPPIKAIALFENTFVSSTICYTDYNSTSNIAPSLTVRLACSKSEIYAHYFPNYCPTPGDIIKPLYMASYPLLNACIYSKEWGLYLQYNCN